jgi:glycine hydroxymethyltransferase
MAHRFENELSRLVATHEKWRARTTLNMLASENITTDKVQRYLASDLGRRYTLPLEQDMHGETADNGYAGTRYTDEVEALASAAAARLLGAKYANVRPLSGHIAAMTVISALLPKGSRYMAVFPEDGGYDGYAPGYLPTVLGHEVLKIPLHGPTHRMDADEVAGIIRKERPEAVILGQSFVLFPYPLKPIAEAVHRSGGLLLYDASHVLGLVMGGKFQDPLGDGVDVVYGSTHKSFFGPQGGIFATNSKEHFHRIDSEMTWRTVDNAHWNRIAALGQALLEMERVGPRYAERVIDNSQALARSLDEEGIPVLGRDEGYTQSHQVFFDGPALKSRHGIGIPTLARKLEAQDIIIDLVGRIGTAEVSRIGLGRKEMRTCASLIRRAAIEGEDVRKEVHALRNRFKGIRFR